MRNINENRVGGYPKCPKQIQTYHLFHTSVLKVKKNFLDKMAKETLYVH
jgi:hypothetical protein